MSFLKSIILSILLVACYSTTSFGQTKSYATLANKFITSLTDSQKNAALYQFESDERYNWHFVPREDRKGVYIGNLSASQKQLAFDLLKSYLSEKTFKQAQEIIQLELVLRELENRKPGDWMRDPNRYAFIFFGKPADKDAWGWRFEGHHISFSFSTITNKIISGAPSFMGSNPGIVLSGPYKGKQVLKEETQAGFKMVQSLTPEQLAKATIAGETPAEIITAVIRKPRFEKEEGILYSDLTKEQQGILRELLTIYTGRYTAQFAKDMMKEIEKNDIKKLRFAYAGTTQDVPGKPNYYRIEGPTIIIEYDNTQNHANHVHTVIRDLEHDFGGDALLNHYKKGHHIE